jgi:2-oxoglutarate ferredoxin oxidoreductase subunit alpha
MAHRKKPSRPPNEYLPFEETEDCIPPLAAYGEGYRYHVTGLTHDSHGYPSNQPADATRLLSRLQRKMEIHKKDICKFEEYNLDPVPDILVISYGSTARVAKRAVRLAQEENMSVGLLRLITLWPFPDFIVSKLAKKTKAIIVPEQNQGQVIREVERFVKRDIPVVGVFKYDGMIMEPTQIYNAIKEVNV